MSIKELKVILLGKFNKISPKWNPKRISNNEYRFINASEELVLYLNSNGNIELMEKFINGYLEYRTEINLYKKFSNSYFPRKIKIFNFSKKNQWTMITSKIQKPLLEMKPLNFKPPEYLNEYIDDY